MKKKMFIHLFFAHFKQKQLIPLCKGENVPIFCHKHFFQVKNVNISGIFAKTKTGRAGPTTLVAGAWTERKKMFHGGSFLNLADDNKYIQNPEAQNRELSGF